MNINDLKFTTEQLNKAVLLSQAVKNLVDVGVYDLKEISNFIKIANGIDTGHSVDSNVEGTVDKVIYDEANNTRKVYIIDSETKTVHVYGKLNDTDVSKGDYVKVKDKIGETDGELYYEIIKLSNYKN